MALLTENVQRNHEEIGAYVTPFNHAFNAPAVAHALSPWTAAGRAALDQMVTLQATVISYGNDFKLMMLMSIIVMPLVFLLRKNSASAPSDHAVVME
jgi:DHA2 family multidrug resistance protein